MSACIYTCKCGADPVKQRAVTIKIIEGKAVHNILCKCGLYMELSNPKSGCAGFSSNQYGQL